MRPYPMGLEQHSLVTVPENAQSHTQKEPNCLCECITGDCAHTKNRQNFEGNRNLTVTNKIPFIFSVLKTDVKHFQ